MRKFTSFFLKSALFAAVAGLGLAGSAHAASPQLSATIDGHAVTGSLALTMDGTNTFDFGGNGSYAYVDASYNVIGFSTTQLNTNQKLNTTNWAYEFKITATDNAPGLPTSAQLFDVTSNVRNNGNFSGGGPNTVALTLSDSTYQLPTGSVYLSSVVSGNLGNQNPINTFTSTYTGNVNGSVGTVGGSASSQFITSSATTWNSSTFTNSGTSFTLSNTTTLYLNPNETSTTNGKTYLLQGNTPVATPEPATMALALSGLGVAGLARLRRRKTVEA
jgi:hypothetical protein